MNLRTFIGFTLLLAIASSRSAAATADTNASPATRAVFDFLSKLPDRKERRVITGQFCDWYPRASLRWMEELKKSSGQTPGLLSLDYFETFIDPDEATQPLTNKPPRWQAINPLLAQHWRDGGLVTLSVHTINPWSGKKAWDKQGDLRELVRDGLPTARLRAVLDPIAQGLDDLQKQGVIVLFRPYHELTSTSFWWAGKDTNAFQQLWRATFRYFTENRELHNLLWVFNPHSAGGERAMLYYPGDMFVDVVSFDLYNANLAPHAAKYKLLCATGKPFLLAEYGPGSPPAYSADFFANGTFNFDYSSFPDTLTKQYPACIGFVAWRGPFSLNKNCGAANLLNNRLVLNREQLAAEPALRAAHSRR